ncbi:MAG: hypothetical protein ACFB0B_15340 [Thermonemataceae bacterium]
MSCIRRLTGDITIQCETAFGGTGDKMALYNFDEWRANTTKTLDSNFDEGMVYSSVVNGENIKAHLIEGKNDSIGATEETTQGIFQIATHTIVFLGANFGAVALGRIQQMLRGKFVAVYESNQRFYVAGEDSGLEATVSRDTNAENAGAYTVTLTSAKEGKLQKQLAIYVDNAGELEYDPAQTRALFESLLVAGQAVAPTT